MASMNIQILCKWMCINTVFNVPPHKKKVTKCQVWGVLATTTNWVTFTSHFKGEKKGIHGFPLQAKLCNWFVPSQHVNLLLDVSASERQPKLHFSQEALHCWLQDMCAFFLNTNLPNNRLKELVKNYSHLLWSPHRFPYLTPCGFFLWGYFKDNVQLHSLSQDLNILKQWIMDFITSVLQICYIKP